MHDGGGGGFSGGGGHDGGGFFGGGHHSGHDGGGGFGGGHHHHHQADFRPHDLINPTDPVYGKRYGGQASDSQCHRPARAMGRVAMWIPQLVFFAILIFFIWQFLAAP